MHFSISLYISFIFSCNHAQIVKYLIIIIYNKKKITKKMFQPKINPFYIIFYQSMVIVHSDLLFGGGLIID